MTTGRFFIIICSPLVISIAGAQGFDASSNGTLNGDYFVREVLIAGQNAGSITSATSVIGVVTFDGGGKFAFSGQKMSSMSGPVAGGVTVNGTYAVAANGLIRIDSLVDANEVDYGGVSALGPGAFVASATEGASVDILIGIPAGSAVSNIALNGGYSLGYLDFFNADTAMVREAMFSVNADGMGNLGAISVSGAAANLGGGPVMQTVPGVAYSLSGEGLGTVNFGDASGLQLISGTKTLYISADKSIVLAGAPDGFDLLVGIQSLTEQATNSTSTGEYYIAGVEEFTDAVQQAGSSIDGFYGSANANGSGVSIFHNRFQSFQQSVYDLTFDTQYSVNANGTFAPSDVPYQFTLGLNGRAFIATGTSGLYSLVVGLGTPLYAGSGVYLNPLGVVNAASFAPITNPVAPNELVSLFGTGMASAPVSAASLPLPKTLGGVQVMVNGQPAPLFYVSPTQITMLVPSSIAPANGVYYATVMVTNNGSPSNQVTVYTSNTAPGVFSIAGAIGPAAAQHADYSLIDSNNPANPGETILIYLSGGGIVAPAIPDGAAAPSDPLSSITSSISVDFGGQVGTARFAGLTPGLAGLYQINAVVPFGGRAGSVNLDLSTPDAYTSQSTIDIAGVGTVSANSLQRTEAKHKARETVRPKARGLQNR